MSPPPPIDDDDDDYMNMVIEEAPKVRETLSERQRRKQRESEIRGRPKSKADLAREEIEKREAALAKSLIDADAERTNKGLRMMKMMGFKPGSGLGKRGDDEKQPEAEKIDVRLEPIAVSLKDDRAGIGMDSERKRKLVEAAEAAGTKPSSKRREVNPDEYREGLRVEREERRKEAQFYAAQKVCEQMDMETEYGVQEADIGKAREVPLRSINVLWRGWIRYRENREAAKRIKYDMLQSIDAPKLPGYDKMHELDAEDKLALGMDPPHMAEGLEKEKVFEEDEGEGGVDEDEELTQFEEKSFAEKLDMITAYLRLGHRYCFWCKYKYKDEEEMTEGCPGTDEDSHG